MFIWQIHKKNTFKVSIKIIFLKWKSWKLRQSLSPGDVSTKVSENLKKSFNKVYNGDFSETFCAVDILVRLSVLWTF